MESEEEISGVDPLEPTSDKVRLGPPDRWMYCPPLGNVIAKHFLPFKTPLCKLYDDQVEKKYQFHPRDVFTQKFRNTEPGARIGLWIDLTKTNRYYSRKEVEKRSCIYKKMPMKGHGEAPTPSETAEFCRTVKAFLQSNPKDIVAVHCTHGFNRTGFLIAAYLASALDWSIDAAILAFSQARPDGIYKQLYLDDLFSRYGDEDDKIQAPPRPEWENGPVQINGFIESEGIGHPSTSDNKSGEPKFMDGAVPSVEYVKDATTRSILQNKIREMCGYRRDGFPGSQPVSMERSPELDNLKFIAENQYMVSWKADGLRYMVLINDQDSIFAFDRDNNVFRINGISFPHRKELRHLQNTLLDCEMIVEKVNIGNEVQEVPRLLIYDVIKFEGQNVGDCNFKTRLLCIRKEIIEPRIRAMKEGLINRQSEPMSIRMKDFWELQAVRKFFDEKFTKNVGHEIDGLIFQPVNEPYRAGRCDLLLKWKPPSHNSIDFKLQIRRVCKAGELPEHIGFLYVQHEKDAMAQMKATKKLLPYDNKIVECTFNNGRWEFMRERTDKSLPNSIKTARAVFNSIKYPIQKETLITFVEQFCVPKGKKRLQSSPVDAPSANKKLVH